LEDPHRELASADPDGRVSYRPSGVWIALLLGNTIFAPYMRIADGDGEIIQQGA
jgi:hypothetical protein